MIESASYSSLE